MRILPEIANLMYQITALMLSKQRRDHTPRYNIVGLLHWYLIFK